MKNTCTEFEVKLKNKDYQYFYKKYESLVHKIAKNLVKKMHSTVEEDDLIQSGWIGLFQAVERYSADQGASFETFAGIRIRGEMIESVRKLNWTPRSVCKNTRVINKAIEDLSNELFRAPTKVELAEYLNCSISSFAEMEMDVCFSQTDSLEEFFEFGKDYEFSSTSHDPYHEIEKDNISNKILNAFHSLSCGEKDILSKYYQDEMSLRKIGEQIGVSESRICQLSKKATIKISTLVC